MKLEELKSKRYVEVYATNNEGETMVIRKTIKETGVHETYMNIYDKLMDMGKSVKWEVKVIHTNTYNEEGGL